MNKSKEPLVTIRVTKRIRDRLKILAVKEKTTLVEIIARYIPMK